MQPFYVVIPASRLSIRRPDARAKTVLEAIKTQARTLAELAQTLQRSQVSVFLDLCWLEDHAFIRELKPRRRVHD